MDASWHQLGSGLALINRQLRFAALGMNCDVAVVNIPLSRAPQDGRVSRGICRPADLSENPFGKGDAAEPLLPGNAWLPSFTDAGKKVTLLFQNCVRGLYWEIADRQQVGEQVISHLLALAACQLPDIDFAAQDRFARPNNLGAWRAEVESRVRSFTDNLHCSLSLKTRARGV